MKERTKAYAAGLIDAEGCISIYQATSRHGNPQYQARIVLSNVNLAIVKWLVATFGGFYTKHSPKEGQVWYQWNINSKTAASSFLRDILPYLRIKKEEALVLQEFYNLEAAQNPSKRKELMDLIRGKKNRECVTTDTLDGSVDDKLTHAYLAGIMDGEGCISAAFTKSGKPMLRIRMGNNYFPLIDLFQRLYGGWFHTQKARNKTLEFYTWEITTKEQREKFLLQITPYLRIKREQAEIALQLVRLPRTPDRELRKSLCDRIRILNKPKTQPDLIGDYECAPVETLAA